MDLSIIVTYHNEGEDFLSSSLVSIRESIDIENYEIIVVDDFSEVQLPDISGVKIVRHLSNKGVGAAFDTGVKHAKSENLFLTACDTRFLKNNWASSMVKEIQEFPKAFTCTSCVPLNKDNMDLEKRLESNGGATGATILMFHDKKSNPRVEESFRGILEAKWLPKIPTRNTPSYEIPCILGAAYGVSKTWYNYVDGWAGHMLWGTLEPYISLKSWLFGGSCRCAPRIDIGHIFKIEGTHGIPQAVVMYNKMFVSMVLFDDYERIISFLGHNSVLEKTHKMITVNKDFILRKKVEYKAKIIVDILDYMYRWDIDFRTDESVNELSKEYNGIYAKAGGHYTKHYEKSPYLKVWNKVASYIHEDDSVIDIGCGPGQMMRLLLDKGVGSYMGYDFSRSALAQAKAKIINGEKASIEYRDLYNFETFPEADAYTLVEVMEHIQEDKEVLANIPGGKVIITVPSYLGGSHVRKFDTEQEVIDRYKDLINIEEVTTIQYGTGKIFVLYGLKN